MSGSERVKRSMYMEWAKTHSHAKYNLATSGMMGVPLAEFPLRMPEFEVTAPGGYGYEPLQERMARHNGVSVDCVVAAAGTSMANHLAMAAVLNPGDEVVIEEPVYGPMLDVVNYLGARVKRVTRRFENGFALELDALEKAVTRGTRLIVLTNFHNPSGALIPAETIRSIGEMAHRIGARVLVDEVYIEMLFDGEAPLCFPIGQTIAPDDNPFIVTSSLTKVYGLSGLRCGWILATPALAKQMWLMNDLYGAVAAHPAERMSVMAFDNLEKFRARAQSVLEEQRPMMDGFLDSRDDLECFRPSAGTVFFPRLKHGDPEAFFRLLREKYETSVVPGSFFEMPQHFRIGIGGDIAVLRAGLERLSAALDELAAQ